MKILTKGMHNTKKETNLHTFSTLNLPKRKMVKKDTITSHILHIIDYPGE